MQDFLFEFTEANNFKYFRNIPDNWSTSTYFKKLYSKIGLRESPLIMSPFQHITYNPF